MLSLKKIIKSNKKIYSVAYNIQSSFSKLIMTLLVFLEMTQNRVKIFLNKKVELRRAHFYNNNVRKKIFKKLISQQINEFKKNKKDKDNFVLIEIGSLIGASIEVWGNELSKKIKNFTIISIDPFEDYVNQKEKKKYKTLEIRSNNTNKLYTYFLHNNSLLDWRKYIIHIRDYSKNGLQTLLRLNIKSDFIYIDGAHDYKNVKEDLRLSKKLIYKKKNYTGTICGDDYIVNINEHRKFGLDKEEFLNLLNKNKQMELITISSKSQGKFKNITFHPGITYLFTKTKDVFFQLRDGLWKLKM
jgi:ABC-type multidrug transport system fused ATPase/permease subunit